MRSIRDGTKKYPGDDSLWKRSSGNQVAASLGGAVEQQVTVEEPSRCCNIEVRARKKGQRVGKVLDKRGE